MSFVCTAHLTIHQWDKEVDGKIVRVKLPQENENRGIRRR